ncbi:MAG: hypothetical protein AAB089_06590 [Nitrospirota bacterium]
MAEKRDSGPAYRTGRQAGMTTWGITRVLSFPPACPVGRLVGNPSLRHTKPHVT